MEVVYANGDRNRYAYDALGNRQLTQYGMGASVRYGHDPADNIVAVAVTEKGTTLRQTVEVGDMNRVESIAYEGAHTLRVAYDGAGRPVRFDANVPGSPGPLGMYMCEPLQYGYGLGGGGGSSCPQLSSKAGIAAQCPVILDPPGDCSEEQHERL